GPAVLARDVRPPPADRLSWRLDPRGPARGLGRRRRLALRHPPAATGLPTADRPVHPRARRRRGSDLVRRTLTVSRGRLHCLQEVPLVRSLAEIAPAVPDPDTKRRLAAAVD